MEDYEAKINGMTCASCERIISKSVSKIDGTEVKSISAHDGQLLFRAKADSLEAIRQAIVDAGYKVASIHKHHGAARQGGDVSDSSAIISAKDVLYGILDGKEEWLAERQLAINSSLSLISLFVVLVAMYFGLWQSIPNFSNMILPLLMLGAISVVALVAAGYHFASYHKPISCSIGMMEGMTFGMMTGFLVGALLGATNGMFWGSTLGMVIGCIAGIWGGWSSGVMGIMEGLMAGVMSGTMGAMLSVMLLAEPLVLFLALLTFFCVLILVALAYMQIKELGRLGKEMEVATFTSMASTSLIFFVILVFLMVYGPKSGPVFGG